MIWGKDGPIFTRHRSPQNISGPRNPQYWWIAIQLSILFQFRDCIDHSVSNDFDPWINNRLRIIDEYSILIRNCSTNSTFNRTLVWIWRGNPFNCAPIRLSSLGAMKPIMPTYRVPRKSEKDKKKKGKKKRRWRKKRLRINVQKENLLATLILPDTADNIYPAVPGSIYPCRDIDSDSRR